MSEGTPEEIFLSGLKSGAFPDKDLLKPSSKPISFKSGNDLHGLALSVALARIERAVSASGFKRGVFVLGKGRHSPGLYSPLRIGVEMYLEENAERFGLSFRMTADGVEIWKR